MGELETFALSKSYLLGVLNEVLTELCLYIQTSNVYNLDHQCVDVNGGPRPSIFELELPLSDICWKEKTIFSQYKTVVTVINIDRQSSVKKPTSKNTSSNNTFPIFTLCTTLPISFFLKVGGI